METEEHWLWDENVEAFAYDYDPDNDVFFFAPVVHGHDEHGVPLDTEAEDMGIAVAGAQLSYIITQLLDAAEQAIAVRRLFRRAQAHGVSFEVVSNRLEARYVAEKTADEIKDALIDRLPRLGE